MHRLHALHTSSLWRWMQPHLLRTPSPLPHFPTMTSINRISQCTSRQTCSSSREVKQYINSSLTLLASIQTAREVELVELLTVREMEVQPELSLAMSPGSGIAKSPRSSSSDSDRSSGGAKKRKHFVWDEAVSHASGLELQLGDPLPLDWEQCLDLHSGRMYYLNRKTMKKSWERPKSKEEKGTLNLELNISTTPSRTDVSKASPFSYAEDTKSRVNSISSGDHMVAVPCVKCHLLVMLCKSSPACPNCKFVQPSVPVMPQTPPRRLDTVKPLETLSLLH